MQVDREWIRDNMTVFAFVKTGEAFRFFRNIEITEAVKVNNSNARTKEGEFIPMLPHEEVICDSVRV